MTRSAITALARAADSERPRERRARDAAEIVRAAGGYRGVAIYDVADDDAALLARAGDAPPSNAEAIRTRATVMRGSHVAVPVLGAETGIVIGTLEAASDGAEFSPGEIAFLEECAAVLRPLYD